ncbi:MAG: FAD-dependent oxidoreductase, partial [Geminicoccaceae bacterium]|nr:FAD-dependent oxidoreductase [Geminicoccaceae bacterium]
DFKLEKWVIDRRLEQLAAEGVRFRTGVLIGRARPGRGILNDATQMLPAAKLLAEFDAVVLAGGAEVPRDLPIPGRELDGIHFAMEFLPLQNKRVAGDVGVPDLWASGKHVVVIGGGDTGSDCVGTANRHGAASVTQLELLPMPPEVDENPVWPYWPTRLRTSSSHEEGVTRDWSVATKAFVGEGGRVKALRAVRLAWRDGKPEEIPGSEFSLPADLVLLA